VGRNSFEVMEQVTVPNSQCKIVEGFGRTWDVAK
jgi:hypothetical protein